MEGAWSGFFPDVKWFCVMLTTPSSAKFKHEWSYNYSPPYALMVSQGQLCFTFPFTFLLPLSLPFFYLYLYFYLCLQGNISHEKNMWQMLEHLGHVFFSL
jgi:hypothetical protein